MFSPTREDGAPHHDTNLAPDRVDAVIAQWEREVPGADMLAYAVMARLRRAGSFIADRIAGAAQRRGMTFNDYLVLATLRRAGPPYMLGQTQLRREVMVTVGAISKRVDRLVAAGYVATESDPSDHRVRRVRLTDAGYRLTQTFMPVIPPPGQIASAFAGFTPDEMRTLNDLLRRLLCTLER